MILHNLFFLVLTGAVYLSVMPVLEVQLERARSREIGILSRALQAGARLGTEFGTTFRYSEGTLEGLGVPSAAVRWLTEHPAGAWIAGPDSLAGYIRRGPGIYGRIELSGEPYERGLEQARWALFVALGAVYVLSVLLLELVIMPTYVYRPLSLMLKADSATRRGDQSAELIPDGLIPGDEIGRIMRSRNQTVADLRRREHELEEALEQLEEANRDLQSKNAMLEAARQNLVEQDRLASLGLLSASVAHEMNTPLAVLRGSIEQFAETVEGEGARNRTARMLRVTERLQRICESLLDFARQRKREQKPVGLRGIVEEAWNLVAIDERAAQVKFVNRVESQATVLGDEDRLSQVFVNLLRNAVNAVKPGGRIATGSRTFREDSVDWVEIWVEDDGPGIPDDVLPNIFEAFVTTRLDSKGTGLGLTVAEGIVQQHGGSIRAGNNEGGGARIGVRLPVKGIRLAVQNGGGAL